MRYAALILLTGILALCASCSKTDSKIEKKPLPKNLGQRFGKQPFLKLIEAPAKIKLKEGGEVSSRAATCGACHQAIYREWQQSTHAYALKDPQFLAELAKKSSPRWLCLNCHIPLKDQREYLVNYDTKVLSSGHDLREIEKIPNPTFDAALQKEAITCATCHVRKGDNGEGVVLGPRGNTDSPHLVKHDKSALNNICVRCHTPGPIRMTPSFFCWFETDKERQEAGVQQTCAACHMPEVQRPLALGGQSRKSRHHYFAGSPVPKRFDDFGKMKRKSGLDFFTQLESKGEEQELVVTLKNARGGHTITTADPERHLLVDVLVSDGEMQKRFTKRIGQVWDFGDDKSGREAKRLSDTRIAYGQERVYRFKIPKESQKITTRIMHVRLSPKNAKHMQDTTFEGEVQKFHPGIEKKIDKLEKNYPFFAYIFFETRFDLQSSTPRVETLDQNALTEKSEQARDLSLEQLENLLDRKKP